MKFILIFFVMLFSISSSASCLETLWKDYKWNHGSEEFKACIVSSDEFYASSKSILCDSRKDDVSDAYKLFRNYESQFANIIAERDAEKSPAKREFLNSEAMSIENQWVALGYKGEILTAWHNAFKKQTACEDKF